MRRFAFSVGILCRAMFAAAILLSQAGCRATPLFNLLGSFFPAWLVCLAIGISLTFVCRWIFRRYGIEPHMRPLVVVYPSLTVLLTCTIWLFLFS